MFRRLVIGIAMFGCLALDPSSTGFAQQTGSETKGNPTITNKKMPLIYVDTMIENGSPLWYEWDDKDSLQIHLLYDHERESINRAAGHFHFRIQGSSDQTIRCEFNNLNNYWNSTPGSVARELLSAVVSDDGKVWESIPLQPTVDGRVYGIVQLKNGSKYMARVEPYRISDLDKMLARIRKHPAVEIHTIGKTVEGRSIEIVQVGSSDAKHQIFLRARAHPWEAGGNWVVEGILETLLADNVQSKRILDHIAFFILPMANKDGVARGRTRFNSKGKDLNRDWNEPASLELAPENAALERWLESRIQRGNRPTLALELHNDGNGKLHISRPPIDHLNDYITRMELLESLLRRYTWFSEGSTAANFRNAGTLGEGWLLRYGIDAIVHEFNCNIIASLNERPLGRHWQAYGSQLPLVFEEYLKARPEPLR